MARRKLGGGIGVTEAPEAEAPVVVRDRVPVKQAATVEAPATVRDTSSIGQEVITLAQQAWIASKDAYARQKEADKLKADLTAIVVREELPAFEISVSGPKGALTVTVGMEARETEKIDVALLRSLVSEEDFLKIVSASKAEAERVAGKNVAIRASRVIKGSPTLKMSEKK